jgi:hypothetical protein
VVEKARSSMEHTEKTAALLVIEEEKALIEEKDLAEHAKELGDVNQHHQDTFHTPTGGVGAADGTAKRGRFKSPVASCRGSRDKRRSSEPLTRTDCISPLQLPIP